MKNSKLIKGTLLAFALTLFSVSHVLSLGDANDPMQEVDGVEVSQPYVINTVEDLIVMVNNHLYTYQSKDSITSDQLPPSN